ncbi:MULTISPECIES: ABC transporter permease [Psychrobacter]|uniref:ABC transporter permease n=1 Tax=Psychrobacter TaxID=497 RepID=UPI00280AF0C4|nr:MULTISPECIES: ABC transporter permease [Psychrobacter]
MTFFSAWRRSAAFERRFLRKNPWDLAMVLWIPLVTIALIWWIFSQSQVTNLPIGVIDEDHGAVANTVVRYLDASPDIYVQKFYHNQSDAQEALLRRDIYAVVIIPNDFTTHILSKNPAPIILQVNAQYGTHSGIIQKSVQSVVGTVSAGVEIQQLIKQGASPLQAAIDYSPIKISRISLFNEATNYQQFLASTVIPALLHILAMVIGATTIGRELRDKTLGHWAQFIAGQRQNLPDSRPINSTTAITPKPTKTPFFMVMFGLLGKYAYPTLAFTIWAAISVGLASYPQQLALSSILLTYGAQVMLLWLSFWLGAIFTLATFSLRTGLSATGFISAPSYAFAGVTFPYIAMSQGAQYWSDLLPLTHYLKLQIAQLQMGAPALLSLPIFFGLIFAAIIAMLLTTLLTRRALSKPDRWGSR